MNFVFLRCHMTSSYLEMHQVIFPRSLPSHLHSPGSASCRLRSQPCGGSPGSCAAAELSLSPAASDSTPGSSCCSPEIQSFNTLFDTSCRAGFTALWFHNSLYKKWLTRIQSALNTNPIPTDILMCLLEFCYRLGWITLDVPVDRDIQWEIINVTSIKFFMKGHNMWAEEENLDSSRAYKGIGPSQKC